MLFAKKPEGRRGGLPPVFDLFMFDQDNGHVVILRRRIKMAVHCLNDLIDYCV